MRHLFWRGVEAGVGLAAFAFGVAGVVIWDQSRTKKPTVTQRDSLADAIDSRVAKRSASACDADRPTAPRSGGTA